MSQGVLTVVLAKRLEEIGQFIHRKLYLFVLSTVQLAVDEEDKDFSLPFMKL